MRSKLIRAALMALAIAAAPGARAATIFAGEGMTFEAGLGQFEFGKSYSGMIDFPGEIPATSLYVFLKSSTLYCLDGTCGSVPETGDYYLPVPATLSGNRLNFEFTVPEECFSGECDRFVPGQYVYSYPDEWVVYLYENPLVLGDFDSHVAYSGSITLATSAVPEPAAWALMIFGFGAVGSALRRRAPVKPAIA